MDDRKIKFRGALRGYNKEDVNGYIEALNSKFYEAELEYKNKIADCEKKINTLEDDTIFKLEKEVAELRQKTEESERRNTELNVILKALKTENEELKIAVENSKTADEVTDLTDKLNKAVAENEDLAKEVTELKAKLGELESKGAMAAEAYEKSSRYDKISEQIGSMIVNANVRAEGIVSTAKQRAKAVSNGMIDNTREKLLEMSNKYTNMIISDSEELSDMLRAMAECVEGFRAEMTANVGVDCDKLKEEIETIRKTEMFTEDNNG
ncbi:MAG: hypothetical protein IJN17_07425 [Clostridia bacterium]|nr:hypothetical protein [Clostridia bacterium]